jgi:hypothetical protein
MRVIPWSQNTAAERPVGAQVTVLYWTLNAGFRSGQTRTFCFLKHSSPVVGAHFKLIHTHPCASNSQPAYPHYTNRANSRAAWTRQCVAKRQERKRQARATNASTTTAGLFITSPGFEEDGGSNSSPKRPSLERAANYSLMNKSGNTLQSDGNGTRGKPL